MDVLFDLTPLDTPSRYRGIGRYATELGKALAELNPADLVVGGLTSAQGPAERAILDTPVYAGRPDLRPVGRNQTRMRRNRRYHLARLVRESGARLLHITEAAGTPLGLSIPKVVTCHDLIPLIFHAEYLGPVPFLRQWRRQVEIHRYRSAQRVIAISQHTRRDLIELLGVPADRIDVVEHGIDHAHYQPRPLPSDADVLHRLRLDQRPYILYIGGGDTRKNLVHLIRAFAAAQLGSQVDLVFAGMLADAEQKLRREATARGVGDSARFLGFVDDGSLPALYRGCLAHAFPTLYEGFGFPVVEAMACGAPSLTTPHASLGDITGDAALTVDGRDERETAAALKRLVTEPALRSELALRGPKAAERYTWRACAEGTLETYRRALHDG